MTETTTDAARSRRYSRQVLLPEFGVEGQQRLGRARVLVVGAGGLGSPAMLYLAAAGIGTLVVVDFDAVDESNLQRQVLYSTADVGRSKVEAARDRIQALNPLVRVECVGEPFGPDNALRLARDADVVVDGSDNFPTRYMVNDACVLSHTPNVFGSIRGFDGQASVFAVPGGPCYRCLHPEPPPEGLIPTCADGGVLGVLPGVIGAIQATEAIKILTGIGDPLVGRFLLYDARRQQMRTIALPRDPACACCGDGATIREVVAHGGPCRLDPAAEEVSVDELLRWRAAGRPHVLVDVREPGEHATASIDGAVLIPLDTLLARIDALTGDRPVVVHCQVGIRSARAARQLRARGVDARSLVGGIEAWLHAR